MLLKPLETRCHRQSGACFSTLYRVDAIEAVGVAAAVGRG